MMASAIAGAGWKTRHCTLVGTVFSWSESENSETLGYCEMLGAVVSFSVRRLSAAFDDIYSFSCSVTAKRCMLEGAIKK